MLYIKCRKNNAEEIRKQLVEHGMLSRDYEIIKEEEFVYFPVVHPIFYRREMKGAVETLKKQAIRYESRIIPKGKYEFVEIKNPKKREARHSNIKDELRHVLTDEQLDELITSFDIIGDIIIIELPDSLQDKEKEIGKGLMRVHPNVRVVAKKCSPMKGIYRIREMKVIAGEQRTETIYKEHGCNLKLDVAKVYFSVRLSHERKRIADLVRNGEQVLVMFAGVGPFAILIGKKKPLAKVVGIELNPDAVKYFNENIKLNKLKNVTVAEGDVKKIVPKSFKGFADRVLMPLPKSAEDFLDEAFIAVKPGGTIHLYTFAEQNESFVPIEKRIRQSAARHGYSVEIVNRRVVRPYSPHQVQVVVDIRVNTLN